MPTFLGMIIPNKKRKDGTWNVKIRVIQNRQIKYISTPFYVSPSQITRGYKIKDTRVLDQLNSRIDYYNNKVYSLGFLIDNMDVNELVEYLESPNSDEDRVDFFAFMLSYIEDVRSDGRKRTADTYQTAYNSLFRYNKKRPLYFQNITKQYIHKYFSYIKSRLSENTVISYISALKLMYKAAQLKYNDEDTETYIVKNGVFSTINLPNITETERVSLTTKEMQRIIDVPYCGKWVYDFTKDMFILSFLCFGINSIDLFNAKKSQYKEGILTYRRHKIARQKGRQAEMKIKMCEVAQIILQKYSGDRIYLIDFGKNTRSVDVCRYIHHTFQCAGLEEPTKYGRVGHVKGKYVFYTNRHTMATLARNECGIDYMTVHQMLNHSIPSGLRTTDVYVHRDYSNLWEANDKLIALFDWSFYLEQKKD